MVNFCQLMLVVTGVMHEADNAYSIQSTWCVIGRSDSSKQHTFVNNYCRLLHFNDLLDMSFSLSLHFLPVLNLQASVCSTLSFILFIPWVIMNRPIRLFFFIKDARPWKEPSTGPKCLDGLLHEFLSFWQYSFCQSPLKRCDLS